MLFDDGNSFENWAETLPRQDSHERHGCACCSALPSLLADQVDDVEQLTQSEHWAARGPAPSEVVDGLWINRSGSWMRWRSATVKFWLVVMPLI